MAVVFLLVGERGGLGARKKANNPRSRSKPTSVRAGGPKSAKCRHARKSVLVTAQYSCLKPPCFQGGSRARQPASVCAGATKIHPPRSVAKVKRSDSARASAGGLTISSVVKSHCVYLGLAG